jgi:hypothetical protein
VVGLRRTKEIRLFNKPIPPQRCKEWNLVNEAVPYDELDDVVEKWAHDALSQFSGSIRSPREQLHFFGSMVWGTSMGFAEDTLTGNIGGIRSYFGMCGFVGKRPRWTMIPCAERWRTEPMARLSSGSPHTRDPNVASRVSLLVLSIAFSARPSWRADKTDCVPSGCHPRVRESWLVAGLQSSGAPRGPGPWKHSARWRSRAGSEEVEDVRSPAFAAGRMRSLRFERERRPQ